MKINILIISLIAVPLASCGANVNTPSLSSVPLSVEKELETRNAVTKELEKDKTNTIDQRNEFMKQQEKSQQYFENNFKEVPANEDTLRGADE